MNNKQLESFLHNYADELKSDFDWSSVVPCNTRISMAGGYVIVETNSGEAMASFHTPKEGQYNPSFPVANRDVQGAKLLVDVINFLGGKK